MRGIEAAFSGRIGSDPEEKTSAKGVLWCSFSVAADGNEEKPTWVKVAAFGDVARHCVEELRKGSRCYVEGALRLSEWQDKRTGETRHGLEVAAWHVTQLGPGKNKPARPKTPRAPDAAAAADASGPVRAGTRDWQAPADAELPI